MCELKLLMTHKNNKNVDELYPNKNIENHRQQRIVRTNYVRVVVILRNVRGRGVRISVYRTPCRHGNVIGVFVNKCMQNATLPYYY